MAGPRPTPRPGRAGRTPRCRRSSSASYLREFEALLRARPARRAGLRALRRRLRARPHRLPARHRRRRRSGSSWRTRRDLVACARRLDVRRARRRPGPRRAAAGDVLAAAIGLFGAVKTLFDPDEPAQPRGDRRPGAARRRPAAAAAAAAARRGGFAYPHDGGDFGTAVHRCVGVGKCRADTTATGGVMCPSYLATRDEKDSTRGRARVLQETGQRHAGRGGWQPRGARGARSVPVLQGLRGRLPGRASTWPPTRPRRCTSGTGAGCGRRALRAGLAAPLGPAGGVRRPRLANAALRRPVGGAGRSAAGGIDQRRPLPRFAAQHVPRRGSPRPAPADGDPVLLWVDTFTDHFTPRGRAGRGRGAGGRRLLGAAPRQPGLLRADLDLDRPAGRRPPAADAHPGRARPALAAGHPDRRARTVLHRGAALGRRRAAAGRSARAPIVAGAPARWPSCSPHARLDAAGPDRGARRWPSRTATSTRCSAGTPTGRCSRGAGAEVDGGRRLLRAGRQLRGRARPLRGVGGGGRDGAAAGGPGAPARRPPCWPTGSPAAPSSSSWPTRPPALGSCWPAAARARRGIRTGGHS